MKKLLAAVALVSTFAMTSCMSPAAAGADGANAAGQMGLSLGIMVLFFVMMYFIAIRPQRKQEKEQKTMLESMTVGDTVLTTAGFYGVVIDITSDTIIVEFGNNKNCRIPMQKASVVRLEHPEGWTPSADTVDVKDHK